VTSGLEHGLRNLDVGLGIVYLLTTDQERIAGTKLKKSVSISLGAQHTRTLLRLLRLSLCQARFRTRELRPVPVWLESQENLPGRDVVTLLDHESVHPRGHVGADVDRSTSSDVATGGDDFDEISELDDFGPHLDTGVATSTDRERCRRAEHEYDRNSNENLGSVLHV